MIEVKVYLQSAMASIPSIILWILLGVLIVGFAVIYLNHNDNANCWLRGVARLMLVEWILLIFCSAVVFRNTRPESAISLVPLSSYFCIAENSYLREVTVINLLNICMFLPVGFFLKCGYRSVTCKQVLLAGFLLSATIEFLQLLLCKGLCEIDDAIHNVVGCMIGFAIYLFSLKLFKHV